MKNYKKIVSVALSSLMLASSVTVLAAERDIYNADGSFYKGRKEMALDKLEQRKVSLGDYLFEGKNGKLYSFKEANEAYKNLEDKTTLLDHLEENVTPVGEAELKVESVSAITTQVAKATGQQLEIEVNGSKKVTVADLEEAGYTVEFLYNVITSGTEKTDGVIDATIAPFNADFKYAVKATPVEGDAITSDWTTVKVVDANVATQVTEFGLDFDLNYITMSDEDVEIKATKALDGLGKEAAVPTVEKVTSSDITTAYYTTGTGIKALKPGTVTFTVKFAGIEETYDLAVEVKAAQKATSVKENATTIKVEADSADSVKFNVLDQYGESLRVAGSKVSVKVGEANATDVTLTNGEGTLTQTLAKGTHRVVVKSGETQIATFNIEAVDVTGNIDEYKLVFADNKKTELDVNPIDEEALKTLAVNVEAYKGGVKVGLDDTKLEVKSSDDEVATASRASGVITVNAVAKGDVVVSLYTVEGDLKTKVAEIPVTVKNTTPQVTTLTVKPVAGENKGKLVINEGTTVDKAAIASQLTTGDTKLDAKLSDNIISNVTYSKADGKVIVTIADEFGGESFVFDIVEIAQ